MTGLKFNFLYNKKIEIVIIFFSVTLFGLIFLPNAVFAETFKSIDYSFKIDYPPENWIYVQQQQSPAGNIFPALTLVSYKDMPYQANANILIEKSQSSPSDYFKTNKDQITKFYGPLKISILGQGNTTINNNTASFIQFDWIQPSQNKTTIKVYSKQYILQKNDNFYVITYTHPEDSIKSTLVQFDDIVSTFQFLDQKLIPDKYGTFPSGPEVSKETEVPFISKIYLAMIVAAIAATVVVIQSRKRKTKSKL